MKSQRTQTLKKFYFIRNVFSIPIHLSVISVIMMIKIKEKCLDINWKFIKWFMHEYLWTCMMIWPFDVRKGKYVLFIAKRGFHSAWCRDTILLLMSYISYCCCSYFYVSKNANKRDEKKGTIIFIFFAFLLLSSRRKHKVFFFLTFSSHLNCPLWSLFICSHILY